MGDVFYETVNSVMVFSTNWSYLTFVALGKLTVNFKAAAEKGSPER